MINHVLSGFKEPLVVGIFLMMMALAGCIPQSPISEGIEFNGSIPVDGQLIIRR